MLVSYKRFFDVKLFKFQFRVHSDIRASCCFSHLNQEWNSESWSLWGVPTELVQKRKTRTKRNITHYPAQPQGILKRLVCWCDVLVVVNSRKCLICTDHCIGKHTGVYQSLYSCIEQDLLLSTTSKDLHSLTLVVSFREQTSWNQFCTFTKPISISTVHCVNIRSGLPLVFYELGSNAANRKAGHLSLPNPVNTLYPKEDGMRIQVCLDKRFRGEWLVKSEISLKLCRILLNILINSDSNCLLARRASLRKFWTTLRVHSLRRWVFGNLV